MLKYRRTDIAMAKVSKQAQTIIIIIIKQSEREELPWRTLTKEKSETENRLYRNSYYERFQTRFGKRKTEKKRNEKEKGKKYKKSN